ncbi:PAS domain S-box protein [Natrialbaceae archaeon AArc-T1-2]|uniref:PAS domain S-box protein n=1 Tax=Natrialbaceae archaeon AArc-T1-2 TaxID=3053904 RepID=UPI00255A9C23|nr:PAS domain S-box protein [Natrialbaceae archaeon AArc-T1-2]WIV67401.1 PAS domain S-box protein [Natrialbaceae archaeon AArc-T1-2]
MDDRTRTTGGPVWDDADETEALCRYRTLINAVDDGIYQLDAEGRFVAINDAIAETTGYDREELLGEHVSSVLAEDDAERFEREIRTRLEGDADDETAFEVTLETAAGEFVRCEVRLSLLVDDGDLEGTVGVVRDDSSRVRNRDRPDPRSARVADESITSVIDEADVGVFVLDDSFDVVWIDETVEEYFGLNRADVVGRDKRTLIEETIRDRLADPDAFAETVLATYDDNTYVEQFECRITSDSDRDERWLEHRSTPIESGRYAGGRIELYYDITARRESERSRRESERRLKSLVDAVEEYAIFMLDPDGHVVSWNEGAERIKGYDSSEILGEHFSTFYTDDDRAASVPDRNLERASAEGAIEDEGWRVRADGSRFWADVTITAIRDEGEVQGYAKVTRDMTDQREREQQLQRERDLVERILEASPVGIAVVNADGSISRANERMAALLSLSPEAMSEYVAGQRDMFDESGEFIPVEDRPASRVFETGEPLYDREVLVDPPTGERTWLSINATPITDEEESPEQVVVTATDITDLKELAARRKQALEEREKELEAIRIATDLLEPGEPPVDDLLEEFATKLPQFFRHPDRTAARVSVGEHDAVTEAFEPCNRQISAHTSTEDDTPIAIDVVDVGSATDDDATPFLESERELIETLATLLTVHFERRAYITELRTETRRLEQFAYAASHDLQEPLRMISSYLQLLERRYGDDLDEDGREFLAFAVDGAERMREMIDGLLAYSRVETQGEPLEPIDLNTVLEDVLSDLEVRIAESDAEITVESLPRVDGDASQLRQLFQNLLDNAIEYSDDAPRIHVSADRDGAEWVVSVRDEGIGIDPEQQDRIFDVFQRLHGRSEHTGTGIGLALCERIVERHGGEIRVESEPGEGSTFSVTLPAAAADS